MKKIIFIFIISILIVSCNQELKNVNEVTGLITDKAMVVSARVEASKIGTEILKKGGNAFDAMMATELALAVSYQLQEILVVEVLWFIEKMMVKSVPLITERKLL